MLAVMAARAPPSIWRHAAYVGSRTVEFGWIYENAGGDQGTIRKIKMPPSNTISIISRITISNFSARTSEAAVYA
jgi:hypothetical protein